MVSGKVFIPKVRWNGNSMEKSECVSPYRGTTKLAAYWGAAWNEPWGYGGMTGSDGSWALDICGRRCQELHAGATTEHSVLDRIMAHVSAE